MMSSYPFIAASMLAAITLSRSEPVSSPDQFLAAYRAALAEKSVEKLNKITYSAGQTNEDKKQIAEVEHMLLTSSHPEIEKISLHPLPANFPSVYVVNGKRIEPTFPPAGLIEVDYKRGANGPLSTTTPYAIIEGHYYVVSSKTTPITSRTGSP